MTPKYVCTGVYEQCPLNHGLKKLTRNMLSDLAKAGVQAVQRFITNFHSKCLRINCPQLQAYPLKIVYFTCDLCTGILAQTFTDNRDIYIGLNALARTVLLCPLCRRIAAIRVFTHTFDNLQRVHPLLFVVEDQRTGAPSGVVTVGANNALRCETCQAEPPQFCEHITAVKVYYAKVF